MELVNQTTKQAVTVTACNLCRLNPVLGMGCQYQIDLTVQVNEHTVTKPAEFCLKKVPYAPSASYVFVLIQPI